MIISDVTIIQYPGGQDFSRMGGGVQPFSILNSIHLKNICLQVCTPAV